MSTGVVKPKAASLLARALLTDWDDAAGRFGKVIPKDYKRVLAFDACNSGHGTTYSECFREGARIEIEDYIKTRLKTH